MKTLTFNNPDPATGSPGTLVTTDWFQNVNDEIALVITDAGITLSETDHTQLNQALQKVYAPLISPNLTGTPTTTTPPDGDDSQKICNTAWVNSVITAGKLGYTPVRQGGVSGQGTNTVYIGWATDGSGLLATVDSTDHGAFAFQPWVEDNYLRLSGGNITGSLTLQGASVATVNTVNNAETDIKDWTEDNYLPLTGGTLTGGLNVDGVITGASDIHVGSGKYLYVDNLILESTANENINIRSSMYAESGINLYFSGASSVSVPTVDSSASSNIAASTAFVKNQGYIGTYTDTNTNSVSQIAYDKTNNYLSIYDSTADDWVFGATQSWVENNYLNLGGGTLNGGLTTSGDVTCNGIIWGNHDVHCGSGSWLYVDNLISETSGQNINIRSNLFAEQGTNLYLDSANSVSVPTVDSGVSSDIAASTAFVHNYVQSGTITDGGFTQIGSVLTQYFTVSDITAADTQTITFPKSFSGTPYTCVVTWSDTNNASSYANIEQGGLSSTQVVIRARANTSGNTWVNSGGSAYITVSGPA